MRAALAALALLSCRGPRPQPRPDAAVSTAPVAPVVDAGVDVPARDVPPDRPAVATRGPWQRLPRAHWTDATTLGRWDEPPDLDGDSLPDEVFAMDGRGVTCDPVHRDVPCPSPDEGGDAEDGPARVALIARFSGDSDTAPNSGRLFGMQRVWRSRSNPTARIEAVRFGDFGRGVSARTTLLVDHGAGLRDTVDRVDLYLGAGLERPAGTLVHHCLRALDGTLRRAGSLAVTEPAETPTLWRFASAHPSSVCETDAVALDAALGLTLSRGVTVNELRASPVETHRDVRIALVDGRPRVVERAPRDSDAGFAGDPLASGAVRVTAVARRCDGDVVRYQQEDKSCLVRVERPRGDERCDPAVPTVPRFDDAHPVALLAGGDAGIASLLLQRAGSLVSVALPAACGTGRRSAETAAFSGTIPAGTPVSTDGALVLFAEGHDLWLARRGDPRPALVNVPGGGLARGTVRAIAFLDHRQVAVVIARTLFEFTLDVPAPMENVPETLNVNAAELYRATHAPR